MYKILLVDNGEHLGGGQIIATHIINCTSNTNYKISVALDEKSALWRLIKLNYASVSLHHIGVLKLTKGKKNILDFFRIIFYLFYNLKRSFRLVNLHDLVYINSTRSIFTIGLCCVLLRKPFIAHIHLLHNEFERALIGFFSKFKSCIGVIACSSLVEIDLKNVCGNKIQTISNCLGPIYSGMEIKARCRNPRRIGFFGDLSIQKGFDIFLDLARKFPEINFFAVGKSSEDIQILIKSLPDNVRVYNPVSDLSVMIDELDISIVFIPSRVRESFCMVAIESIAAGCMVVVSGSGYLANLASELNLNICDGLEQYVSCLSYLLEMDDSKFSVAVESAQQQTHKLYSYNLFRKNFLKSIANLTKIPSQKIDL